jgi:hypothetical protein
MAGFRAFRGMKRGGRSAPIEFKHSHFEARDHSRTAQHFHGRNDRSEERAGPYCDVP